MLWSMVTIRQIDWEPAPWRDYHLILDKSIHKKSLLEVVKSDTEYTQLSFLLKWNRSGNTNILSFTANTHRWASKHFYVYYFCIDHIFFTDNDRSWIRGLYSDLPCLALCRIKFHFICASINGWYRREWSNSKDSIQCLASVYIRK